MATRLIQLADGTLVEAEVSGDRAEQISGRLADKVGATLSSIEPLLMQVTMPVANAWKKLRDQAHVSAAEIELGISFEGEGNLYVTKTKAAASLTVKLTLKATET